VILEALEKVMLLSGCLVEWSLGCLVRNQFGWKPHWKEETLEVVAIWNGVWELFVDLSKEDWWAEEAGSIRGTDHVIGKDPTLHFPVEHLDGKSNLSIVENRGGLGNCCGGTELRDIQHCDG